MESYSLEIFADYNQILMHDEMSDEDLTESWSDKAYNQMVIVSKNALAMSTVRNMDVPVEIVVVDDEPCYVADEWDHIVRCSLNVSSGSLIVRGVSDYLPDAKKIAVTPGQYTAWLLYGGLDTIDDDGIEGEDRYSIVLCRSELVVELVVLKDRNR